MEFSALPGAMLHTNSFSQDLMRIWDGDLSSQDGAFRCLLIIDYIADWARDVYRENVIEQLKSIATTSYKSIVPPSPTFTVASHEEEEEEEEDAHEDSVTLFAASSDTVNLGRRASAQPQSSTERNSGSCSDDPSSNWTSLDTPSRRKKVGLVPTRVDQGVTAAPTDKMREFDVATYAYRNARYIRYQVIGLCITSESVQDLFNSRAQRSAETLFSRIAVQLEKHHLAEMKGSMLLAIEQAWSGIHNRRAHFPYRAETFYVSFTFSAYFSPDWEQTRELCYIAVSKNALDTIKRYRQRETRLSIHEVNHARALGMIETFQKASIDLNLSACLQSCSIRPIYSQTPETRGLDSIFPTHSNLESIWMKPDTTRKTRDVVWDLYRGIASEGENHARSYLRLDSRLYEQIQPRHGTRQQSKSPWIPCILEEQEHLILCYNENSTGLRQEQRPEWCLFWVNLNSLASSKWTSILRTLRLEITYKTNRLGAGKNWQTIQWNDTNCLETTGFDSKVIIRKCLDALFSALAKDSGESHIEYALSQLQIHSNGSEPSQTCSKFGSAIRVEECDDESSDTQYASLQDSTANQRPGESSDTCDSLSDSEDELFGNIDVRIGRANQSPSTDFYRPRYRPRGLLITDHYRRKRNKA